MSTWPRVSISTSLKACYSSISCLGPGDFTIGLVPPMISSLSRIYWFSSERSRFANNISWSLVSQGGGTVKEYVSMGMY